MRWWGGGGEGEVGCRVQESIEEWYRGLRWLIDEGLGGWDERDWACGDVEGGGWRGRCREGRGWIRVGRLGMLLLGRVGSVGFWLREYVKPPAWVSLYISRYSREANAMESPIIYRHPLASSPNVCSAFSYLSLSSSLTSTTKFRLTTLLPGPLPSISDFAIPAPSFQNHFP